MIKAKPDKKEERRHVEHEPKREDREAPKLGRSMEPKVESKAAGFDRTSYQRAYMREYMRKWRARQKADRKAV
jgi:hypothetical protein